jgi:hypothetical protein
MKTVCSGVRPRCQPQSAGRKHHGSKQLKWRCDGKATRLVFVPVAAEIALLVNPTNPRLTEREVTEAGNAARLLRLQVRIVGAGAAQEIEAAFPLIDERRIGALLLTTGAFLVSRRDQIVALAARHALPTMYPSSGVVVVRAGCDRILLKQQLHGRRTFSTLDHTQLHVESASTIRLQNSIVHGPECHRVRGDGQPMANAMNTRPRAAPAWIDGHQSISAVMRLYSRSGRRADHVRAPTRCMRFRLCGGKVGASRGAIATTAPGAAGRAPPPAAGDAWRRTHDALSSDKILRLAHR